MNNIVLFRGQTSACEFPVTRALPANSGLPSKNPKRGQLVAVWHSNPLSGKLECVWTTETSEPLDEEDRPGSDSQRAA
ncbi:hypothetical protein [Agrobacterium arsenijevicii]|uniref:Uncharacterized protein n=1 Tax=Agrobacterium arsenijevicii TaxID=1585697 RepID=A0ABR5DCP1_9HYPH|nr:hypothetical protein RP75_02405 [Agrobacterium arsenijevicii]